MHYIVEHTITIQKEEQPLNLNLGVECRQFLDNWWFLSLCYSENKECKEIEHTDEYGKTYTTLYLKRFDLEVEIYYRLHILGQKNIESYKEKIDKKINEFKADFENKLKSHIN